MSAFFTELLDSKKRTGIQIAGKYLRVTTGIADNYALNAEMPSWLYLLATTARDVLMPAATAAIDGLIMVIYNQGTGTITLKTSSDAALSPAVTVTTSTPATMQCIFGLAAASAWKKIS